MYRSRRFPGLSDPLALYLHRGGIPRARPEEVSETPESAEDLEAKRLKEHATLHECRQPEGGVCPYDRLEEDDKRCALATKMSVKCVYLGKVVPLKMAVQAKETEEKRRLPYRGRAPKIEV